MKKIIFHISHIFVIALLFSACSTTQQIPAEPEVIYVEAEPTYPDVEHGRFDNGKMWTFEFPPTEYFMEEYGLAVTDEWVKQASTASVRLPNCTASFVSDTGLVLTNHHCTRDQVLSVTRDGENLVDDGYYATNLSDERPIDGFYLDQLITIEDITEAIYEAIEGVDDLDERLSIIEETTAIEQERITAKYDGSVIVEIIPLYNGAVYSAYVFRRFNDVRLVMVPELELGYFGGDPDNFTYPRYTLDMTFLRVYENDEPYEPEYWFNWSEEGVSENEPVFVVGNPGSTSRLNTVAQLEFTRDAGHPALLGVLEEVTDAFLEFEEMDPEKARELELRNLIFMLQNAIKAYSGGLQTLQDDFFMGRRLSSETAFRNELEKDAELMEKYGSLHDEMDEIVDSKLEVRDHYIALYGFNPGTILSSGVLQRAITLGRAQLARDSGDIDAAEYYEMLVANTIEWPNELEEILISFRINRMMDYLDDESFMELENILDGRSTSEFATHLLDNSPLSNKENTTLAIQNDELPGNDDGVRLGMLLGPEFERVMTHIGQYGDLEDDIERRIGLARFGVYGTDSPPDATFSIRLQDGRVLGYNYNGTMAPINTTFFGMYNRHFSHGEENPWSLPKQWIDDMNTLDLNTSLNFVSTNDIIGGNSGSPILNAELDIVGLIFDGNIESLSGDFIYSDETARAISVDVRGMMEALKKIYRANRIVEELLD